MLVARKSSEQMTGLPFVDKDRGILCLVADLPGESAMILVSVGEDDPPNIRNADAVLAKLAPQRIRSVFRFWSDVDERQRIFLYQIDVHVADVEGSGE